MYGGFQTLGVSEKVVVVLCCSMLFRCHGHNEVLKWPFASTLQAMVWCLAIILFIILVSCRRKPLIRIEFCYPKISREAKAEDAPPKFMISNVLSSDKCLLQPKPRSFWSTWRCRSSQHFWDSERHPHGEKSQRGSTLSGSLRPLLLAYFYLMQVSKNIGL